MNDEELSNIYTWEVTSKSNQGQRGVKLIAPLNQTAQLIGVAMHPGESDVMLAWLAPEALESLAQALSYWLTWREQRLAQKDGQDER